MRRCGGGEIDLGLNGFFDGGLEVVCLGFFVK